MIRTNIPYIPPPGITEKYMVDIVQSAEYANSNTHPELFQGHQGYVEAPVIRTAKTNAVISCNGWDIVSGKVMPRMDIVYAIFPPFRYQVLKDSGFISRHSHDDAQFFVGQLKDPKTNICPNCAGALTIMPTDLSKVCLTCMIAASPFTETQRLESYKVHRDYRRILGIVFGSLFNDTILRNKLAGGNELEQGVLAHFVQGRRSSDTMNDVFSAFIDADDMLYALITDFMQSMVRDNLGINYYEGRQIITDLVRDLWSDEIQAMLIPGFEMFDAPEDGADQEASTIDPLEHEPIEGDLTGGQAADAD